MKTLSYLYLIALLLPALIINEQIVQWVLAVRVGSYSVAGGFQDAFKHFSIFGYLFFSKRYAKPPLTSADFLSPFTPPRQSAALGLLQPKLRASVPQSSSSWPRADA